MSTLTILNTCLAANAGQIRLRTIKEGSSTKVVYVNTGNPKSQPRYFYIIYDYPPTQQSYRRSIRSKRETYIAACDIYKMSQLISVESFDYNNELKSYDRHYDDDDNIYFRKPSPLSFEELALQATCKRR
jgi:hypothetical protein